MNILNLPNWHIIEVKENENDYLVTAEPAEKITNCRFCSSLEFQRFGKRTPIIMHLPMHGKRVGIKAQIQRYKCLDCERIFQQPAPDTDEKRSATVQLVEYIRRESLKRTFTSIADEVGMDEKSVRRIFADYAEELEGRYQFVTPIWLGIDEVSINRTPRLIITNIKEGTVYDLFPSRKQDKAASYLYAMADKEKVELVAMDMWKPYKQAVEAVLPQAKIVIDKFHVLRLANKAVDDYRKSLSGELSQTERRELMRSRYILLKRKKDLTEKDKFQLEIWTSNLAMLGLAHELKESFYHIYDAADRHDAKRRYWDWQLSIPKELEKPFNELIRAVRNWEKEIFTYFDYRVTNAFTESINSVIRKIESAGRGYSFEALRTKILYTNGFKTSPRPKFQRKPETLDYVVGSTPVTENYGVPISTFIQQYQRGEI